MCFSRDLTYMMRISHSICQIECCVYLLNFIILEMFIYSHSKLQIYISTVIKLNMLEFKRNPDALKIAEVVLNYFSIYNYIEQST